MALAQRTCLNACHFLDGRGRPTYLETSSLTNANRSSKRGVQVHLVHYVIQRERWEGGRLMRATTLLLDKADDHEKARSNTAIINMNSICADLSVLPLGHVV